MSSVSWKCGNRLISLACCGFGPLSHKNNGVVGVTFPRFPKAAIVRRTGGREQAGARWISGPVCVCVCVCANT